jgi:predicted nucleic acid-binding protein
VTSRPTHDDWPAFTAIGCTIRVTGEGAVTVRRDPGCTPDNVRDLCEALLRDELEIVDLTESGMRSAAST